MNTYIIGVVVVLIVSALAVTGMLLVRNRVGLEKLGSFNEVAGNSFQVVGTFYAVLLGLIVVDAMTSMADLRVTIDQEANAVGDTYILARGLPEKERIHLQSLCVRYVDVVLDEEWSAMKEGKISRDAIVCVNNLWKDVIEFKPNSDAENDIRSMCLGKLSDLGDNRRARLIASQHGTAPEIWAVLIIGAALTIAFSYFLGLPSLTAQILMTVIIATTITLNVYLVYLFGYPLSGPYAIAPEGFLVDRLIFKLNSSDGKSILKLDKTFNPRKLL